MKHTIGNFTIEEDDKGYVVSRTHVARKGDHKGEEVSVFVGYFNGLHGAVKRVAMLSANKKEGLEGWIKEFDRICMEFQEKVERYSYL